MTASSIVARPGAARLLAVVVSGAAYAAAFPPSDFGWLAWVSLVPLCVAAAADPPRTAFRHGYLWGLVAFGGVLWWLVAFGPLVWGIAAALFAVFPAAATGIAAWAQGGRRGPLALFWMPLAWTVVEFVRSQGPLGFPWALAGESQHAALAVAQVASIAGVWGVSFVVVLGNALLAHALLAGLRSPRAVGPALAAAVITAAAAWGGVILASPVEGVRPVTVAVVQPNAPPRGPATPSDARVQLAVLDALTREAASRGAQLVVWPETAYPTDVANDPAALGRIGSWTRQDRVALIASSLEGGTTDSAFAFSPDGFLAGRYDKVHLVPFAEFGEHAGRAAGVLPTPSGPVGVAICFESVFPELARRSVLGGSDLLAVLTNDAWFSGPAAPEQHAAAATFRAIEEGRYLLRAANSGISEIVDPRGRVVERLPLGARGVLVSRVEAVTAVTPYGRFGDLPLWVAAAAVTALLARRARQGQALADPAFVRLLVVSAVPLVALAAATWISGAAQSAGLVVAGAPVPLPVLAALAATVLLSVGRPARALGFQAAGFVPAAAAGLGVVGAVAGVAANAFAAQGAPITVVAPPGGWWVGTAVQVLVVGLTFEWWLRGLVYAAAFAWRGWRVAVVWSALLGMVAAAPRGAEAMVWGGFAGLAFGAIRTRWPQVPALSVAHGAGAVVLGFLLSPW